MREAVPSCAPLRCATDGRAWVVGAAGIDSLRERPVSRARGIDGHRVGRSVRSGPAAEPEPDPSPSLGVVKTEPDGDHAAAHAVAHAQAAHPRPTPRASGRGPRHDRRGAADRRDDELWRGQGGFQRGWLAGPVHRPARQHRPVGPERPRRHVLGGPRGHDPPARSTWMHGGRCQRRQASRPVLRQRCPATVQGSRPMSCTSSRQTAPSRTGPSRCARPIRSAGVDWQCCSTSITTSTPTCSWPIGRRDRTGCHPGIECSRTRRAIGYVARSVAGIRRGGWRGLSPSGRPRRGWMAGHRALRARDGPAIQLRDQDHPQ